MKPIILLAVFALIVACAAAKTPEEMVAEFRKCVDASTSTLQRYYRTDASAQAINICKGELYLKKT